MTIETQDDVAALKRIGKIVSYVLQEMLDASARSLAITSRTLSVCFGGCGG